MVRKSLDRAFPEIDLDAEAFITTMTCALKPTHSKAGDTVIAIEISATSRLHSKYLQHITLQIHKPIIKL